MSKSTKQKQGIESEQQDLSFEEAIKRLEEIVTSMESQELPLETLLEKFEEGTKLCKLCQNKLVEAEQKIQVLMKNANGEFELKPFALQSENDKKANAPGNDVSGIEQPR